MRSARLPRPVEAQERQKDISYEQRLEQTWEATGSRLNLVAQQIEFATETLASVQDVCRALNDLRTPLQEELESRLVEGNQVARLVADLKTSEEALTNTRANLDGDRARLAQLSEQAAELSRELEARSMEASTANEALERLRPAHQTALAEVENLKRRTGAQEAEGLRLEAEKETLARQLDIADETRRGLESSLGEMREAKARAEASLSAVSQRIEEFVAENTLLNRSLEEAHEEIATAAERTKDLESRLGAVHSELRQHRLAAREATETHKAEARELKSKLEEARARLSRLEEVHAELAGTHATALDAKTLSQRQLSAGQAELKQRGSRIEALEQALSGWQERFGQVEAARFTAIERAEQLQMSLTQREASAKRLEMIVEDRESELRELSKAAEAEKTQYETQIAQLRGELAQVRAETKILKASSAITRRQPT